MLGSCGNPTFAVLVPNDLLACVVICRAWQAELGRLWGSGRGFGSGERFRFGMVMRHAFLPSPPFLFSANYHLQQRRSFRSRAPVSEEHQLSAGPCDADGQTDVEHSCSPVRQWRAGLAGQPCPSMQVRPLLFPGHLWRAPWTLRTRSVLDRESLHLVGGTRLVYPQDSSCCVLASHAQENQARPC